MNTQTNINAIVAEVNALVKAGEDAKAEERLIASIAEHTEAEPNDPVGQSVLLNELGGFYRSRGAFEKGEKAYLKAAALLKESMTANYATTLNNLAGLYRLSGQYQKAAGTFDTAISAYENCEGDAAPDILASVYNNKGLVYLDMRKIAQARAMFLEAKARLIKGGDFPFALGTTISNLGFAAVIEEKFSEAAALFREAKALFERAGDRDMVQNCEEFLSKLERCL